MRRKKEHLIPLEKSKRVIYLDKRGRKPDRTGAASVIFGILSLICLFYCLAIGLFVGYGSSFFLVWGILAICFALLCILMLHKEWVQRVPKWIQRSVLALFWVGIALFVVIEVLIMSQFGSAASPGADYMIVLGAQWKENGPSYVLQKRLDAAVSYLKQNPDTQVIVSGGKGSNEPISEAEGMYEYLANAGIEPERIQMENQSMNTSQNLKFSGELLDKSQNSVVLVTNNFHIYRAVQIAQKQGYRDVQGLSASSYPGMLPNNMLREFFGILKDFAVGNL